MTRVQFPVPCPECRGLISPDSFTCLHCGAPVGFIWEDCRQACHVLRLGAVFLLAGLLVAIIVMLATGALQQAGVAGRDLAIVSAITAAAAALWKFSDALSAPRPPWELNHGADRSGSSGDGSVGRGRKEG